METRGQFIGQQVIDQPLARHPVQTHKGISGDMHTIMGAPFVPVPGMACMAMAVINDFKGAGGKTCGQFGPDSGLHRMFAHGPAMPNARARVKLA
jgi:hypothetical protein